MSGPPLMGGDDAGVYGAKETCFQNLLRISREITTITDPDQLCRTIVAHTGELLGFDCCSLLLLDEEGERLVEACACGFDAEVEPWIIPLSGDDPAACAVRTGAPVLSTDLERRLRPPRSEGGAASSALCLPLRLNDKAFGSLAGFTRSRREFSDGEVSLLQSMADLAAPAIQNARHMRALRESEVKFRTLFNSASDAVFISSLDGRLIEVNQMACDRLGYSRDELLTMAPQYTAFPHYMTEVSERPAEGRDSTQLVFETIHIRKDGSVFPVEVSSRLIEFDGAPAFLGMARDITERRQAEETLHEVKERLKIILHSIQAGIILIDADTHKIVDANDTAILMTGYSRSELVGSCCRRICPCDAGGCPITEQGQQVDNSERVLLTARGRQIPILKSVVVVNLEGRKHLLESFIDITDRKLAEEALKRSHDFAKTVLDSINDSVCIIDVQDRRILGVNRVFLQELGLNEEEVIGQACSEAIASCGKGSEGNYFCPLEETLRTGEYAQTDQVFTRNGETVHVEVSTSPIRNKDGQVVQVVHVSRDISERKRAENEIQQLAYYDTLTGLPNRLLFRDRLNQSIAQAARDSRQSAVFFLDLDRFKGINDSLGHAVGDKLLKTVARRLLDCVRKSDTVARLGGDEFVLILSAISHEEDVGTIAGKVLSVLAAPVELDGQEIFSTGSIGIAVYPVDGEDVDTLLKNADIAMYQAKEQGRNNYQFFSREMNVKAVERLVLEMSLRHAMDREEFFLFYQPQVNLATGLMTGMEALLRWRHPDLGIFSPAKFVPLAEESGLIVSIGEWVLRTACMQNKKWQQAGYPPVRVAVNLSAHQFMQQNLVDMVAQVLEETGLDPEWLELELTESALMENVDNTRRTLRRFRDMGIRISIDDFGTGYSSLSYLKHFPIDRLKIAQYFVRDITTNPDDAAIAEAIIAMAHSLKLNVIAEGVERREQMEFLRSRFCDEMQGYYFSVPVSADDFTSLLAVGASLVHN